MSRFFKAPLVITLLVGLVFSGYWQVFPVKKALANPPISSSDWLTYQFAGADRQSIVINYNRSGVPEANNPAMIFNFANSGKVVSTADEAKTKISNGSAIVSSGLVRDFWGATLTLSDSKTLYLITARKDGHQANLVCGLYTLEGSTYKLITDFSGYASKFPDDTRDPGHAMAKVILQKTNATPGSAVVTLVGNEATLCTNLDSLWGQYVDGFKLLFGKAPAENSAYWEPEPPTGVIATTLNVTKVLNALTGLNGLIINTAQRAWTDKWSGYVKGYQLNSSGVAKGIDMREQGETMVSILESLKAKKGNAWATPASPAAPGCPAKLLDADWSFSTASFATPNAMIAYLDTMGQFFKDLVSKAGEGASGGSGKCGNLMGNMFKGQFFEGIACTSVDIIHSIASWAMSTATKYLKLFIGVDIKLQDPKTDPNANINSSGSTTGTGGTGTSGTGTTTGTDTTPATTGQTYRATATSCTPEPCYDQSWNFHGQAVLSTQARGQALCKQQKDNPGISSTTWDAGICLSPSQIDDYYFSVSPKNNTAGQDMCHTGGKFITYNTTCSQVLKRNDTVGEF